MNDIIRIVTLVLSIVITSLTMPNIWWVIALWGLLGVHSAASEVRTETLTIEKLRGKGMLK